MKPLRQDPIFNNLWRMINIIIALGTLAAAYGGIVNPEITSIPAILAMTFPLWLLLSVIVIVIAICIPGMRKTATIPAIGIACCIGPILAYAPMHFSTPAINEDPQEPSFTLLSYNTLAFNDIQRDSIITDKELIKQAIDNGARNPTASYIISTDADILCLQEFRGPFPSEPLFYTKEQVDTLKRMYPYYRPFHGEDIMSRFPLKAVELRQPQSPYAWFGAAIADIQGHRTLLVSLHLQSIGLNNADKELFRNLTDGDVESKSQIKQVRSQLLGKLSNAFKERAKQARMLREQIDSIGIENVIVAGDFNDIPDCFALRELCRDDFKSAFASAGCGPEITYHANRFYFHIDHILYRGAMRAVAYQRGVCPNSDHYPIMARFVWDD